MPYNFLVTNATRTGITSVFITYIIVTFDSFNRAQHFEMMNMRYEQHAFIWGQEAGLLVDM